jgi:hypothetical protein
MDAMTTADEGTAVWSAFLHAHAALLGVLEARLQDECRLPLAWYDVLKMLARAGATTRMQDLTREVLPASCNSSREDALEAAVASG